MREAKKREEKLKDQKEKEKRKREQREKERKFCPNIEEGGDGEGMHSYIRIGSGLLLTCFSQISRTLFNNTNIRCLIKQSKGNIESIYIGFSNDKEFDQREL